jgi:hypothetical protein
MLRTGEEGDMFDDFEIHRVAEFQSNTGTYCEQVDDDFDPEECDTDDYIRTFWTLYGHYAPEHGHGIEALVDSKDLDHITKLHDYFIDLLKKTGQYRIGGKPKVTVEVMGGCAEVTECPDWIDVKVVDHDCQKEMSDICMMDDIDCSDCEYKEGGDVSEMINRNCPYVED